MEINNQKTVTKVKLAYRMALLLYLIIIVTVVIFQYAPNYIVEITSTVLFALCIIFAFVRKYHYIHLRIVSNRITLRYYPVSLLPVRYNVIQIPVHTFDHFKLQTAHLGLRKTIVLYQSLRAGTAKYPPVSTTLLTKEQRDNFIQALIKFSKP